MQEKQRWQYRFDNFKRAYFLLQESIEQKSESGLSQLEKEGVIQRFEYTMELAWKTMRDYLAPWAKQIERVALFGSRATGKYKTNSDIDLVIYETPDEKAINRLWTLFNESNIPHKVDINAYHLIDYSPFKPHIDNFNRTLFVQEDLII